MNPYDRAAVSAVWQRVTQGKQDDCLENALSEAIANEHRSQNTYLAMAKHGYSALFQRLAAQEACHARRLSTLYYLLFGCPPCQKGRCLPRICNFCEAVRDAFHGELKAAKNYQELANSYPDHASLFCAIAKDERQHACLLRTLTEKLLCK